MCNDNPVVTMVYAYVVFAKGNQVIQQLHMLSM